MKNDVPKLAPEAKVTRRAASVSLAALGGGDEGWYSEMGSRGTTKLDTYGRFVGSRHASFSNILW